MAFPEGAIIKSKRLPTTVIKHKTVRLTLWRVDILIGPSLGPKARKL
jgi:hypothetical protein